MPESITLNHNLNAPTHTYCIKSLAERKSAAVIDLPNRVLLLSLAPLQIVSRGLVAPNNALC